MFRARHCPSSGEYETVHVSDWYWSVKTADGGVERIKYVQAL